MHMKPALFLLPVLTFIAGALSVYFAQAERVVPTASATEVPAVLKPLPAVNPPQPSALVVHSEIQVRLEKRIEELQASLKLAESQLEAAVGVLRVTPSAKVDPDGTIFRSLVDADGNPVASYDTVNRVFHYNPAEAVLLPADGKVLLNRKSEIAADLKSTASEDVATLRFENETKEDVYLFWIDYQGRPIPYDRIRPGEASVRPTYMTHPWVVTDLNGNRIGDVKPELKNQTEVIPVAR
jgi:hypothetical protein